MHWKCRNASVLLVQPLMVQIFLSSSRTFSSNDKMLKRTVKFLVYNYSNSLSISNWTALKPRCAASLWMFPVHLMNMSTLPFSHYSTVRKKKIEYQYKEMGSIDLQYVSTHFYFPVLRHYVRRQGGKVRPCELWCFAYRLSLQ